MRCKLHAQRFTRSASAVVPSVIDECTTSSSRSCSSSAIAAADPPTYMDTRSISEATNQARSSGHQGFGPSQCPEGKFTERPNIDQARAFWQIEQRPAGLRARFRLWSIAHTATTRGGPLIVLLSAGRVKPCRFLWPPRSAWLHGNPRDRQAPRPELISDPVVIADDEPARRRHHLPQYAAQPVRPPARRYQVDHRVHEVEGSGRRPCKRVADEEAVVPYRQPLAGQRHQALGGIQAVRL